MYQKYVAVTLLALSLIGCASVPMGDAKQDTALKTFSAKSDVAGVYIYRNESMGAAVRMDVELDGKPVGQTAAKTYFYNEIAPGKHTVISKSENTDTLEFEAVAGRLYYVWQEVKMGVLYARTKLHLVGDTEGKKGVLESQLAANQYLTNSNRSAPLTPASTASTAATTALVNNNATNKVSQPAVSAVLAPSLAAPAASTPELPTEIGQYSYQSEHIARSQSCSTAPRAILNAKGPGFESYTVNCDNGESLAMRCDFGQCRVLK